ncbi:hypothetical protein I4U23_006388 [Adineta vaga]|nr:hypothetical protein I4U23_006388 [Adineta vaga]
MMMMMIKNRQFISSVLLHLIVQLILTTLSSIHWLLLLLIFSIYSIELYKQYKNSQKSSLFCCYYLSSIMFTIIHFIFILSYNKILPWEIGLVILFLLLIIYYARRLGASLFNWDLSWLPIGKYENNSSSIVIIKFLVSNLLFFAYTCQLCLTTVCTPSIYFNWFLIVTDCRYTYTNLLSSYTFAGGVLVLLSWTIVLFLHLIAQRFRV